MDSRAQGLSYIENMLCRMGEARPLIRCSGTISNQHCLLRYVISGPSSTLSIAHKSTAYIIIIRHSFWDCFRCIRVSVFNPGFQRQLSIELDEEALGKAGLWPLGTNDVNNKGPATVLMTIASTPWQDKETLCDEITKSLRVIAGELCLLKLQQHQPQQQQSHNRGKGEREQEKELSRIQGKLADIDIEVVYRSSSETSSSSHDGDEDIIIEVVHLVDPSNRRVYTLSPIPAKAWRATGLVDLCWLRPSDRKTLYRKLLRYLVPYQGYPALQMQDKLFLPIDFVAFDRSSLKEKGKFI